MNILDKVRHKDTTYLTNNIKDNQPAETLGEALKKDEEDIDNLQTTTQTSTVNKKVVIGLFLFFMTVAVTVFIFSSDDSSDEKKENKPKVEVADTQNDYNVAKTGSVDTIPDNYDSLAKHEQQPNKNINNQNQAQYVQKRPATNSSNNTNYYPENNNEVHYSRPVPILQSQPPSYIPKQQTSNTANTTSINSSNTNNEQKQDEKNIFAAAIKFMSFNQDNQDENTSETVTTENPTNNTFSYPQVNNINENTILALLNNENVTIKQKERYIGYIMCSISLLSQIEDSSLWSIVIDKNKLKFAELNILEYYAKFNSIDQHLIDYINKANANIDMSNIPEMFNEIKPDFFTAIVECKAINNAAYRQILHSMNIHYNSFDIEDIPDEKIKILIDIDGVRMNKGSIKFIRDNYKTEVLLYYIFHNIEKYVEIIDTETFSHEELVMLLSENISDDIKLKLLSFTYLVKFFVEIPVILDKSLIETVFSFSEK